MTERATAGPPLEIDRVERAREEGNCVRLRLAGRWLDPAAVDEEELLVVQIAGRRHRFPGTRDEQVPGDGKPDRLRAPGAAWSASFTLPDWAEPRHHGQAALWLGSAVVPVPHPEGAPSSARGPAADRTADRPPAAVPAPPPTLEQPILDEATDDAPRPPPVEDVVLKETVTALHTELAQR